MAVAVIFGYVGLLAGRELAPVINVPDLGPRLAFLAAFDALGIVTLIHVRRFRGEKEQRHTHPIVVFLMFTAIGVKCGAGHGVQWLFATGISNGLIACAVAFAILHFVPTFIDKDIEGK